MREANTGPSAIPDAPSSRAWSSQSDDPAQPVLVGGGRRVGGKCADEAQRVDLPPDRVLDPGRIGHRSELRLVQRLHLVGEFGCGPVDGRPSGATVEIGSGATGDGGAPHSAAIAISCSDDVAYTMRPRPTQACAAAHIGQCSPEVYTVARARSSGVRLSTRPAGDRELGVAGGVAVLDAVAVLEKRGAVGVDQHRAERFVAVVERLAGEFHAAAQVFEVVVADRHRPECTQPRARAADRVSG